MNVLQDIFERLPIIALGAAAAGCIATALRFPGLRVRRVLIGCALALLVLHAVIFLDSTVAYVKFPYEQKSVAEGVIVFNAWQYARGEQPYRDPTLAPFRSMVYPPVHEMALSAVMALLGGPSLIAGRVFSLLCTLGAVAVAGAAIRGATRRWTATLLGGGFLVSCYGISLQWMEQVRNDALLVLLICSGLYLASRSAKRNRFPAGALVALLLATYTKQTALFAAAAVAAHLALLDRRRAIRWALAYFLATGAALAGMEAWSDGWFTFYAVRVPVAVGMELAQLGHAITFGVVTVPALVAASVQTLRLLRSPATHRDMRVWALAFAFGAPTCLLQSLKWGATMNAFLPLVPIVGVLAAMWLDESLAAGQSRLWPATVGLSLALVQLGALHYRPLVPRAVHYEGQARIAEWVRASPGDCLVSGFSSHVWQNGKRYWGDPVIMGDLERAGLWRGNEAIEKVRRGEFALLILRPEPEEFKPLVAAARAAYTVAERIHIRNDIGGWPYMLACVPRDAPWRPAEGVSDESEAK